MTADVNNVVSSALGARAMTSMVEGEKLFDIAIRWPKRLRNNETSILDIPVDIINNQVVLNQYPGTGSGSVAVPSAKGFAHPDPAVSRHAGQHRQPDRRNRPRGCACATWSPRWPRTARPTPAASSSAPARPRIYREQGKRLIAVKFSVRGRDLGSAVDEAKARTKDLFQAPYRAGLGRRSSSRWRTPRAACCGSSRSPWA